MGEITLSIPDELLLAPKVTPEQCGFELRLAAAVKLHEMGRLSSGVAAKSLDAKAAGLVTADAPLLDQLQALDFRLHSSPREAILDLAGELLS